MCVFMCALVYACGCMHKYAYMYVYMHMSADPGSSGLKEMELNVTGTEESYVAINQKLQIVASN